MQPEYGAHEVMEVHEVLNSSINSINLCQMLLPHVKDQDLANILNNQLNFMYQEYNNLVQAVKQRGLRRAIPYQGANNITPIYGLRNPGARTPNNAINILEDRDISSAILGIHKASSVLRRQASLECADPGLRRMIQQGSDNCAEQAYEIWQLMNQKGYYQIPTLKDMTTQTILNTFSQPNTLENVAQYQ